jgi:nucleoside-diphosphate-sugar epimerase
MLDINLAQEKFGFKAEVDFKDGLKKTIDWWQAEGFKGYAGQWER